MTTAIMEPLIKSYQVFVELLTEIEPVLGKNATVAASFSQYIRNFCFAMVTRVDSTLPQHRDFINNLTLIPLPEMEEEEFRHAVTAYSADHYDEYIYDRQDITQALLAYDLANETHCLNAFFDRLCEIADIFASQNYRYEPSIQRFALQYRMRADMFIRSAGNILMNGRNAVESPTIVQQKAKPAMELSTSALPQSRAAVHTPTKQTFSPGPTVDGQYWLRVMVPMLATTAFIMGAIISQEWVLLIIAIAPLCFTIAGFRAAQRRCPNCGAWDSMVTIKSKCVGQQKVKVRRDLSSSYYRTSGTFTFGSRQVFVSADEYTYNEVYRCNICGHQISGTRRAIDDGIR